MLALRDMLLAAVIVIGLFAAPSIMMTWLVIVAALPAFMASQIRRRPALRRLAAGAGLVTLVMVGVLALLFVTTLNSYFRPSDPYYRPEPSGTPGAFGWFLVLLTLLIVIGYRVAIGMLLTRELRPGATAGPDPGVQSGVSRRLDYLSEAQWSNLTLYSTENPFVGAGQVARAWAIAIELDRPKSSRARSTPVVDPQELYDFVRARLVEMRDQVSTPAESLNLQISDQVIARGLVNQLTTSGGTHPLINQRTQLPVSRLGRDAILAIVRHAKAGVRYYQRITISTASPEIMDDNHVLVMPAEDQEIVVSAFVHLAVEGRMLYTEFIVTVLPPIADSYHLADRLPSTGAGRIALTSLAVLRGQLLSDLVLAPFRLVGLASTAIRSAFATRRPGDYVLYNYGARASVREMGAEEGRLTYLQQLDSFRYTKLIGERLNASVLDFLEEHDIDTSAYRQQAAAIVNNGTMISGGSFTGTTTVGEQANVTVTTSTTPKT